MLSKDNNLLRKNTYFCAEISPAMTFRRTFIAIVLTFISIATAGAQESMGFVRRVLDRLLAPSMELDPAAVYQPEPRWTFALTGDLRQAGISQEQDIVLMSAKLDDNGNMMLEETPAALSLRLQGAMDKGIGFQAGYGNLSLALSKTFRGEGTNSTFSFDYQAAGYALQVQFFNLAKPVEYSLVATDSNIHSGPLMAGFTDDPGNMRAFIVDAFYAFNRRTFAYSAAYKGNVIQRRSAGSWMFGTKLSLGDLKIDPAEQVVTVAYGSALQTSAQVSFGGGFSYNFVPLHRQPDGDREKGLRNLTFNVTAIPMVTIFNQFTSTAFEYDSDKGYVPKSKTKMNGDLLVNYVYRLGVGYTRDLYTFNLSASSDSYSYNGVASVPMVYTGTRSVDTSGTFFRWTVGLRVCKRF